jgi:hypothetical protein
MEMIAMDCFSIFDMLLLFDAQKKNYFHLHPGCRKEADPKKCYRLHD